MTGHPASSLRRQLLGWLLVATAVFGVLALIDTYREAVKTANTVSDRVLAGSALAIAERVVVNENGALEVDIPYVALEMLTSAAQDRVFYRVEGPPGNFITGYQALPSISDTGGQPTAYADASFRGEPIRVAVLQRSASTGVNSVPFVVTVAETTIARRQLAQAILLRSALRLGLMIVGAAVIVWIAVTLALRPLYRLSDAIAERNPSDLHPIDQEVPNEVQGLVDTVNSFMVRLQSALNSLRHFSGNASHQLRTPLAIIRTQLALASRAPTLAAAQEAAQKGDSAVAHAERILAQLLLMAKIDAAASAEPHPLAEIDIAAIARSATAEYVPMAAQADIDLGFDGNGPAIVRAEPLLFGEMLRNLIDNAIAYAGPGAEVTVAIQPKGQTIRLRVDDNGPGIPAERKAEVLQRFARGGGSEAPGMGLGLPIVEDIAALFGATLALEQGAGGRGLSAVVTFPAVTTDAGAG
ncbi:two-component system sensor histidine kinase TctE [Mycoplana sp. BE70]|uniref:sensor histidine kinase n=1 Tax=Mycoplana sp. BE70 TaxID=2817775 RepID=UPI002859FC9E|nr:sensor histidine kinase N-terminal domain-containing protein [Mycoplana sp. BE70]MDR6755730.1 two-component system sensor histidine kinase TctE [Mycoplana sp. BE70]